MCKFAIIIGLKVTDIFSSSFSLGYAFHVAAALGPEGRTIFDRIQDAIAQADEVDGRFLQFEGGLSITGKLS